MLLAEPGQRSFRTGKGRHEKNGVEGTGLHKRSAEGWEGPAVSLLMHRGVSPNAESGLASKAAIRIRDTAGFSSCEPQNRSGSVA